MSKRTMRVATAFTGVAACTAIAAPIAHASSGHRRSGSIRESNCAGAGTHPTWLHVASQNYGITCYGFRGSYSPTTEIGLRAECGGNNWGFLSGPGWVLTFGAGNTYRFVNHAHMDTVAIGGWSGSDSCS
jgi:hypothetical protein